MNNEERIAKLGEIVSQKRVLILTHNNPDPDALAAGWAMAYLIQKKYKAHAELAYGGLIARAENRAMVRLLNIGIHHLDSLHLQDFDVFALVDTQPGSGNNSLPPQVRASIVIDHHGAHKTSQGFDYVDIRLN
jgi:nanoRNase/pAp phosphatase (c-di-AMP/oligoRNAs hydrolase)